MGDHGAIHVGEAHLSFRRGQVATTFAYVGDYLRHPGAYAIDPALPMHAGRSHVAGLPGAFADAAPDRWGRNLIVKKLQNLTARAGGAGRALTDVDFLLEVSDVTRQGALRFRSETDGPYLAPHATVPALVSLPRLMRAAERVCAGSDEFGAVKELLEAGTGSLGGARPKASVRDGERLLIAKFPHPQDDWDVMRWEATTLALAAEAGLEVPAHRLVEVDGRGVLLLDRFDRSRSGRVGYLSAMSLVGASDGEARDYVEVADALTESGDDVGADLRRLWRRLVFSVAVRNTDDHLRNHGFLRIGRGWRLAPAFDMNPNPSPDAPRTTGIGGAWGVDGEVGGLADLAPACGIAGPESKDIISEVLEAVESWRAVARRYKVTAAEIDRFAPSLDDARSRLARAARRT